MNNKLSLQNRLQNRDVLIGMFTKINNCNVVEMIGIAGFDFVIFDTEHANFSRVEIENLIRTADSVGINSIVRVQEATPEEILHALDSGADGVQLPGVKSIEQATEACRSSNIILRGIAAVPWLNALPCMGCGTRMRNTLAMPTVTQQ